MFLEDVELMFRNSCAYNGKDSGFTHTAERIVEICKQALGEVGATGCLLTVFVGRFSLFLIFLCNHSFNNLSLPVMFRVLYFTNIIV